jgi:hypothetical protein
MAHVPDDLGNPMPCTATTPGHADLLISLYGHDDAPWLHWLHRRPPDQLAMKPCRLLSLTSGFVDFMKTFSDLPVITSTSCRIADTYSPRLEN